MKCIEYKLNYYSDRIEYKILLLKCILCHLNSMKKKL